MLHYCHSVIKTLQCLVNFSEDEFDSTLRHVKSSLMAYATIYSKIVQFTCDIVIFQLLTGLPSQYGDGAGNTVEENSSIFSLILCASCRQQQHSGSKTLFQQNPPVLNRGCQLMQVVAVVLTAIFLEQYSGWAVFPKQNLWGNYSRLFTGRMPFLSITQRCQSTDRTQSADDNYGISCTGHNFFMIHQLTFEGRYITSFNPTLQCQ